MQPSPNTGASCFDMWSCNSGCCASGVCADSASACNGHAFDWNNCIDCDKRENLPPNQKCKQSVQCRSGCCDQSSGVCTSKDQSTCGSQTLDYILCDVVDAQNAWQGLIEAVHGVIFLVKWWPVIHPILWFCFVCSCAQIVLNPVLYLVLGRKRIVK